MKWIEQIFLLFFLALTPVVVFLCGSASGASVLPVPFATIDNYRLINVV